LQFGIAVFIPGQKLPYSQPDLTRQLSGFEPLVFDEAAAPESLSTVSGLPDRAVVMALLPFPVDAMNIAARMSDFIITANETRISRWRLETAQQRCGRGHCIYNARISWVCWKVQGHTNSDNKAMRAAARAMQNETAV
jgi:hypothetical protein